MSTGLIAVSVGVLSGSSTGVEAGPPTTLSAASGAAASPSGRTDANDRVSRSRRADIPLGTRATASQAEPGLEIDRVVSASLPVVGTMSTCYCERWGAFHSGVDVAAPMGTPIVAAADGRVVAAGPAGGFGNWVVIRHEDGTFTVYGHMRTYLVMAGQDVVAGQLIAKVGSEGMSTGPHLHFEVRRTSLYGAAVDPVSWLVARGLDPAPWSPIT